VWCEQSVGPRLLAEFRHRTDEDAPVIFATPQNGLVWRGVPSNVVEYARMQAKSAQKDNANLDACVYDPIEGVACSVRFSPTNAETSVVGRAGGICDAISELMRLGCTGTLNASELSDGFLLTEVGVPELLLRRVSDEHIEMIRQWRNHPEVQRYMFFNEWISPEMQRTWFANTNNKYNMYFIIEQNCHNLGLVNLKNIDYQKKSAESGVFLAPDKVSRDSLLGVRSVVAILDLAFYVLGLSSIIASVKNDNHQAISFNERLGFFRSKVEGAVLTLQANEKSFSNSTARIRRLLR